MTRTFARELAASRMYLMEEDVIQIQHLVRTFSPNIVLTVIDLGAGSGTTALAVLDDREDAQITTIDIDPANVAWAEKAVRNAYPGANWVGVVADAADTAHRRVGHVVDLLLHDASHERDHVEGDIRAWLPYLMPSSLIWVHDWLAPPPSWGQPSSPGVDGAIGQLIHDGLIRPAPEFGSRGLGWVGRKGDIRD